MKTTTTTRQDTRKRTGAYGEQVACAFLEQARWQVIARNWRRATGELDIVAIDGETLVFIEVRTRTSRSYGSGEESVDWRKQRQVRKIATLFLAEERTRQRRYRFDVIAVYLAGRTGEVLEVRHFRNAF